MKLYKLAILCSLLTSLLTSGCIVGEIGYTPPGIPVRVSVDSEGNIGLSVSHSLATPIGTFDLGAGKTIYSIRQNSDNRLLMVRVDTEVTVYQLKEGKEFKVDFESNSSLYRKVSLKYESDGDIVLELESVALETDPNALFEVSFRLNELTQHVEDHAASSPDRAYYVTQIEIDEGKTHEFVDDEVFSMSLLPGGHIWKATVCGWDKDFTTMAVICFEGNGSFDVYDNIAFWLETGYASGVLGMQEPAVFLKSE